MAEVVRMPKLSDTMEEGVVAAWHKKTGDKVESGEVLAEIETDKATMDFESFEDGTLLYIGVKEGESAPVNAILAILGEEGEDVSKILEEEESNGGKAEKSDDDGSSSDRDGQKEKEEEKTAASTAEKSEPKPEEKAAKKQPSTTSSGRIKVSPLARKLAEDKGIDLADVEGSGDGGRIVKRDIDEYKPSRARATAPVAAGEESYREESVSQMRKTIAKRLSESKFTAPHFYLTMEVNMDNAITARKAVNEQTDVKVSFNDFVIKAASMALMKHPYVNASWQGDKIRFNEHVHVGVAVAVEEGLLVPVVRFANGKGLSQISEEVKEFAQKAKDKKLQPSDWEGNTFTISNLGMYGIEEFTAIINPPDSCILAVGGIVQKPVVKDGEIVPGNTMKVTLSCDHRVVDGVKGAEFLNTFKAMLENPVMMIA